MRKLGVAVLITVCLTMIVFAGCGAYNIGEEYSYSEVVYSCRVKKFALPDGKFSEIISSTDYSTMASADNYGALELIVYNSYASSSRWWLYSISCVVVAEQDCSMTFNLRCGLDSKKESSAPNSQDYELKAGEETLIYFEIDMSFSEFIRQYDFLRIERCTWELVEDDEEGDDIFVFLGRKYRIIVDGADANVKWSLKDLTFMMDKV